MSYEKFNKNELLLFLDVEKIKIDSHLKDIICRLFDNHNILEAEKTGNVESNNFRLKLNFDRKRQSATLSKQFLENPKGSVLSQMESFLTDEPLELYDTDDLLPLVLPITNFLKDDYNIDESEYKFEINKDNITIQIDLTPFELSNEQGSVTISINGKYLDNLGHSKLYTLEDVKELIKIVVERLKKMNNVFESIDIPELEELSNIGFLHKNDIISNGKRKYKIYKITEGENIFLQIEESTKVIFNKISENFYVEGLKHILALENYYYSKVIVENNNGKIEEIEKENFSKKHYEEQSYVGKDGVDKLYDYFLLHDLSVSDVLYDYLKEAAKQNIIISLDFKDAVSGKKLVVNFKSKKIEIDLEPEFSHYVGIKPYFYWRPTNYIANMNTLAKMIKVKRDKTEMLEVRLTNIYKKILQYGFKDVSTKEDDVKRRMLLKKGIYTYQIFSNGLITLSYSRPSRSYEIVLEDDAYLLTVEEYSLALSKVLNNYWKFSKEYGFRTN